MSLVQSIVKTIRSIRQEYNLTKAKPEGIISAGVVYMLCVPLEKKQEITPIVMHLMASRARIHRFLRCIMI